MSKKVFIIGNGFDLNLGWETSYSSFVNSDYWPLKGVRPTCELARFLSQKVNIDRWYDLENILKEYATLQSSYRAIVLDPRDEAFFEKLKSSLCDYLKQEERKDINKDSLAIKVLEAVIANGYFSSIYSFNYTDLYKVAEKVGIQSRFDYESVHGVISRNSIILGMDDKTNVRDGYSFLRKVFSEHYTPHHIRYDLQECNEVVFFGHSLGDNDYSYFSDFFKAQSQCSKRNEGKRITIFTKDNHSRIQILEQLRVMNDSQTERLINDNVFRIIMTENPNPVLLRGFFEDLVKNGAEAHYARLREIAAMF